MSLRSLEQFRALVATRASSRADAEKLSKREVDAAIASLPASDRAQAEAIVLEALANVELTAGAMRALQTFLGEGAQTHGSQAPPSSASSRLFALQIAEAQGQDSVGGARIFKSELKDALTALADAPTDEAHTAVRALLASPSLTMGAFVEARHFLDGIAAGHEVARLQWPVNDAPADFEALAVSLKDALHQAYALTRRTPHTGLSWSGPSTPPTLAGTLAFEEQLTKESLQRNEQDQGREPLDVILGIGLQMGMEQGRRAIFSGIGASSFDLQLRVARELLATGGTQAAEDILASLKTSLGALSIGGGTVGPMCDVNGRKDWPSDGKPASLEDLAAPLRKVLKDAYQLRRKDRDADIIWRGPNRPEGLPVMEHAARLTADNLLSEEQGQGRDALDVLLAMTLQTGMEQGRRVLLHHHGSHIEMMLDMAHQMAQAGNTSGATTMLNAATDMWNRLREEQ